MWATTWLALLPALSLAATTTTKPYNCTFPPTTTLPNINYPPAITASGAAAGNVKGVLDYQDFSVIQRQSDKEFFRFSKSNSSGPEGIQVATAPHLRGPWNYAYQILTGDLVSPLAKGDNRNHVDLWAPDVKFINGWYYLYYTVHTVSGNSYNNEFDLCVARSRTMALGNWTDHGPMGVPKDNRSPPQYVRIDGNLLADSTNPSGVTSGVPYMAFASYNGGLHGFPVSDDYLSIRSGGQVTELVADQPNPPPYDFDTGGNYSPNKTEGGFQLRYKNYNYLFYSVGNCCPDLSQPCLKYPESVYRVQVCRAPASQTAGPYVDRDNHPCSSDPKRAGTYVLASHKDDTVFAPGSVGVLNDAEEGLVMYYQYFNATQNVRGLSFGFNKLSFDSDLWPVLIA